MKQLLQKSALFAFLLLFVKMTFVVFYDDGFRAPERKPELGYSIEDELQNRKAGIAKHDYDTIFVGSSRSAYAIIPPYFDTLTGGRTKSYNFGVNGGVPPQTFDWCEEIIQTKPSIKRIFFELSNGFQTEPPGDDFGRGLAFSGRFKKWEDYYSHLALAVVRPEIPLKNLKFVPRENTDKDFHGNDDTDHREASEMEDYLPVKRVPEPIIRSVRARNLQVEEKKPGDSHAPDADYWGRISRLLELAESKQIRVYFYVPSRLKNDAELEKIRPIYHKLDARHKLSVLHYHESLYRPETSHDYFHLSYQGAVEFTSFLAKAFDEHNF